MGGISNMVFVQRQYGNHKKEIRSLLRRRLQIKGRIRHHSAKLEEFEKDLERLDSQVETIESLI